MLRRCGPAGRSEDSAFLRFELRLQMDCTITQDLAGLGSHVSAYSQETASEPDQH